MAAYIAWKNYYTVNNPLLDAEHKQIIENVNELYVAMNGPMDSVAKKRVLERLVQYTQTHFDHEEKIMQDVDYPDLAAHKALHNDMRRRTIDLRTHLTLVTAEMCLSSSRTGGWATFRVKTKITHLRGACGCEYVGSKIGNRAELLRCLPGCRWTPFPYAAHCVQCASQQEEGHGH